MSPPPLTISTGQTSRIPLETRNLSPSSPLAPEPLPEFHDGPQTATLTAILKSFQDNGENDTTLLLAILKSKAAEDDRASALANLYTERLKANQRRLYGSSPHFPISPVSGLHGSNSIPTTFDSRSTTTRMNNSAPPTNPSSIQPPIPIRPSIQSHHLNSMRKPNLQPILPPVPILSSHYSAGRSGSTSNGFDKCGLISPEHEKGGSRKRVGGVGGGGVERSEIVASRLSHEEVMASLQAKLLNQSPQKRARLEQPPFLPPLTNLSRPRPHTSYNRPAPPSFEESEKNFQRRSYSPPARSMNFKQGEELGRLLNRREDVQRVI